MNWWSIRSTLFSTALVATAVAGAADRPTAEVALLPAPPEIDGIIGDTEWEGSAVLDGRFVQVEPEFGEASDQGNTFFTKFSWVF